MSAVCSPSKIYKIFINLALKKIIRWLLAYNCLLLKWHYLLHKLHINWFLVQPALSLIFQICWEISQNVAINFQFMLEKSLKSASHVWQFFGDLTNSENIKRIQLILSSIRKCLGTIHKSCGIFRLSLVYKSSIIASAIYL